ncbi:helix-turn-helix domain-containing protein [Vagococcus fluvialis]|uniref:helix-turn-helix domain-containing protein n=1 Tax=Vagococcus fluvialis TaxID=2738 RepID=UPI002FDA0F3A
MENNKLLKQKRIENKMTQEELDEELYVSSKTISNWETGKTTPDLDSLIRLKNYLTYL